MPQRRLILRQKLALGDGILMTALVRDIQKTYPGQYDLMVDTHVREIWENNPHCRLWRGEIKDGMPSTSVKIVYKEGILAAGRGNRTHMLAWYHRDFATKTGLALEPLQAKGDLYLTDAERVPIIDGRYWLVLAGGKSDVTVKMWWPSRWQQTVDAMARLGLTVVQTGATFQGHMHPKLTGVIDLVGKYPNARQLCNLILNAEGVICPVTAAMHIAAVFDKPCVVLAGGREEPQWEGYTNTYKAFGDHCAPVKVEHQFLHAVGLLDCCAKKGCWRHRTVPIGRKDQYESQLCKLPVINGAEHAPECLNLITVDHVLEAVMSYYENGTLPPIGQPKKTYSHAIATPPVAVSQTLASSGGTTLLTEPAGICSDIDAQNRQAGGGTLLPEPDRMAIARCDPLATGQPDNIAHPLIGGRFTVFVLCYGDHFDMARRCIESILQTLPRQCLDLRVGLNAVCDRTRQFVKDPRLGITHVYDSLSNLKKYPLMRRMFHDSSLPINTPYTIWFDDDTHVVTAATWNMLCNTIIANHPHGARLYGNVFTHDLLQYAKNGHNPINWFKTAKWWRGRNLKVRGRGMEASNGSVIEFVAGWWWAMASEVIRAGDVPDARIANNGDIAIGEVVHQLGFKIKDLGNRNKDWVTCPSRENGGRRGAADPYPWSVPAAARVLAAV